MNDDREAGEPMQIGMIGLGRMGANLVRRLESEGHRCVVHDIDPEAAAALQSDRVRPAATIEELAGALPAPRVVWIMVPAAAVDAVLDGLVPSLQEGDIVVDGGNSYYRDDIDRSRRLSERGVHYVDCGTSGGVWGLERGYSLMIGGDPGPVEHLGPIFSAIAPGRSAAPATPGRSREGTAPDGYLHCGPAGAGHFVKMVHNGVEYGMMEAIAEGLAILERAGIGLGDGGSADAETTPLADPGAYPYRFDLGEVAEVWRRGSVVASWLVDLVADALASDPGLASYSGRVADSGEGRWTAIAAVEEGVPAPVITAALDQRFGSRGGGVFAGKALSAMRREFGGHPEPTT